LKTLLGRWSTTFALACCQNIIVRDETSAQLLRSLPGETLQPEVSADPVWLFDPQAYLATQNEDQPRDSAANSPNSEDRLRIGISLRHWPTLTETALGALAAAVASYAAEQDLPVQVALLPFQENEDKALLEDFGQKLRRSGFQGELALYTPKAALSALCRCDILFGMRFHSLILGLLAGVRVYGLPYDPKVSTLLEGFQLAGTPVEALETINASVLSQALGSQYPMIDLTPFKNRAQRNLSILDEWLRD
jgi:polysaccharide pyruvyl transferase WcaK-like protein